MSDAFWTKTKTRDTTETDLSSLNQFIDDMDRVVTVVQLAHHLSNALWTDAVIWRANKRGHKRAHTWTFVSHTRIKSESSSEFHAKMEQLCSMHVYLKVSKNKGLISASNLV